MKDIREKFEGIPLPVVSPLTAGAAYAEGHIDKSSTFVKMDNEGAKITGCRTKYEDAKKLYGSGNSIRYWRELLLRKYPMKSYMHVILASAKSVGFPFTL